MLKNLSILATLIFVCLFAANLAEAQNDDAAKVYGKWTGESICADKQRFPNCKDEKVIYNFSKSTTDASKIHLAADKVVNGEIIPMGEFDFTFDAAKNTLYNEFTVNKTSGIWEFIISGDEIEGTLKILPDKKLARRVKVKKEK